MSRDPIGEKGGIAGYVLAANRPTDIVDVLGREPYVFKFIRVKDYPETPSATEVFDDPEKIPITWGIAKGRTLGKTEWGWIAAPPDLGEDGSKVYCYLNVRLKITVDKSPGRPSIAALGAGLTCAIVEDRRSEHMRVACVANLQQVGFGLKRYAYAHGGAYPSEFESAARFINRRSLFLCPAHRSRIGDGPIDEWSDYMLVPGLTVNSDPEAVLAYGRLENHGGKHSRPGLWRLIDGLPAHCRPRLIRGDVSYGSEEGMAEAEDRRQPYLFKLRQTTKVRKQIRDLERDGHAWADAGDGWQGAECELKLMGWSRARRCVFLRRSAQKGPAHKLLPASTQGQFDFVERLDSGPVFEYVVVVTNEALPVVGLAQLYRDRADCENVFDEIKNQWGWAGFVTHDLKRCRIAARLIALFYNWWNVFTRLAQPDRHLEAVTSRPLLLQAVGRLVTTGRRKIIRLTSTHALADRIRLTLSRIAQFLNRLARTAEQLGAEAIWAIILSAAFVKWLRGKVLRPVMHGDQVLLQIPA